MVKKDFLKDKLGFSLFEALVVMSIVSIFVAVMASVIPHKSKPKISAEAHGGFECYYVGNQLYSRTISAGRENDPKPESGSFCEFRPDQYVKYLIFNVVGGGARGGASTGGGAGQYTSAFFPTPKNIYRLYPGKGGSTSAHSDGYPSFVRIGNDITNIVEVQGGNDLATAENTKFSDIKDVYISGHMGPSVIAFGCSYVPRAWKDSVDGLIHVEFCETSANIIEKTFVYSDDTLPSYPGSLQRYKTILQTPSNASKPISRLKPGTKNIWEYQEVGRWVDLGQDFLSDTSCSFAALQGMNDPMCPSRYKMEILLDIPDNGAIGANSSLTKYASMMGYNNLAGVQPGNGGNAGRQAGKHGAILVSW